jgi:hypothetical protein
MIILFLLSSSLVIGRRCEHGCQAVLVPSIHCLACSLIVRACRRRTQSSTRHLSPTSKRGCGPRRSVRNIHLFDTSITFCSSFYSLIGNGGYSPGGGSGGMIPSTAPPFAMTRWVAQTRENYVSVTPYNFTGTTIYGFQGTHQPAIWMGESGQVVVVPGAGDVQSTFAKRGMAFSHDDEVITPSYYSANLLPSTGGTIVAEQSASKYSTAPYCRCRFPCP